jgi:hypothetical protein
VRKTQEAAYRAREPFAVPDGYGGLRTIQAGAIIPADDPLVESRRALLQPLSEWIAETTAPPADSRPTRMPVGVTYEEATKARDVRDGPSTKGGAMPHMLPPEHEDSPASTFAPFQPAAGVQADDVVEKGQAPKGALKASDANKKFAGKELDTSPGHTGEAAAPVVDEDEGKPSSSRKSS